MTNYLGWTPPPGVGVVPPPVHPETLVNVIYSDGSHDEDCEPAGSFNWSSVGDGPSVVAYAVVQEYKPAQELRERYLCVRDTGSETVLLSHEIAEYGWEIGKNAFLMREVPDPSREVVAWAVVRADGSSAIYTDDNVKSARWYASEYGGTVVKLTGVKP